MYFAHKNNNSSILVSSSLHQMTQKQGIVSILASDSHERSTKASSLKRTLSADMSSKTWMAQNGFSFPPPLMKKIASSEHIIAMSATQDSSSEEDEEECVKNPKQVDIWAAILSQKAQDNSSKLPPPYVHPLVKKSASSLSEKSLKVCTESLGSETGSDVFSSYPSSETGNDENKKHEKIPEEEEEEGEIKESDGEEYYSKGVKNTTQLIPKKTQQARSFPPPLASLAAARTDGPSLHMHSRRVDGRLVLEAVSVPSQKYFETQRQDGRFLLTLINNPKEEQEQEVLVNDPQVEFEDIFDISEEENSKEDDDDDEEEQGEEEDEERNFSGENMRIFKEYAINVNTSTNYNKTGHLLHKTVITKNITDRDNMNPSWSKKVSNKVMNVTKLEVVKEEEAVATPPPPSPITQSLPATGANGRLPLPSPTAATSFNSYQYFWRAKPTVASVIDPLITQNRPPTKNKAYNKKDLVLQRGNKADCLLPSLKGCKEPRRSLLMWEPFCIATS